MWFHIFFTFFGNEVLGIDDKFPFFSMYRPYCLCLYQASIINSVSEPLPLFCQSQYLHLYLWLVLPNRSQDSWSWQSHYYLSLVCPDQCRSQDSWSQYLGIVSLIIVSQSISVAKSMVKVRLQAVRRAWSYYTQASYVTKQPGCRWF